MFYINLTNSVKKFKINGEDFDRVQKYLWRLIRTGHSFAIYSTIKIVEDKQVNVTNFIMQEYDVTFDHKDRDVFNVCRSNLRRATKIENQRNRGKQIGNYSSKFKGVCWNKQYSKWVAYITIKNKFKFLGYFENEIDAAKKYNEVALRCFKEFASINLFE